IANQQASGPQPAAFFPKDLAGTLVNTQQGHAAKKILQPAFVLFRLTRIIHSLVEFCEGDHRQGKPFWLLESLQALHNAYMLVEVVDDPIGINKVVHGYSRGSGRVEMSRSA